MSATRDKIKIFTRECFNHVDRTEPLEERVNEWLEANPDITVIRIEHNQVPTTTGFSNYSILIWYEEKEKK